MKKNIYIIVGVGIIVIIGSWLMLFNGFLQTSVKEVNNGPEIVGEKVVLAINDGEKEPMILTVDFTEGMTAFDLLKNKTDESGITLKTKTYDIGVMVEAIGDKENGQDGKYWLYYVNGEMPMVSADKMIIKLGDKVEFKFEKSPF